MANLGRFTVSAGLLAGLMALPCVCAAAVTPLQSAYCRAYADHEYTTAVRAGSLSPDAAYEGAAEECEVQFLAVGVQWDDPAGLDGFTELAMRAASTIDLDAVLVNPLPMGEAARLADALGRYGVERVGSGWLPTTEAEDAAADAGAQ